VLLASLALRTNRANPSPSAQELAAQVKHMFGGRAYARAGIARKAYMCDKGC